MDDDEPEAAKEEEKEEVTLEGLAKLLEAALNYFEFFGPLGNSQTQQASTLKKKFRKLASIAHPDSYSDQSRKQLAENVFRSLNIFHDQAKEAIANHTYGQRIVYATFSTDAGKHEILGQNNSGDLCDVFEAESHIDGLVLDSIVKIAHNASDNDLLQREQRVLEHFVASSILPEYEPFVTKLVDSFAHDSGGEARQANVIAVPDKGFMDLEKLKTYFPHGADPLHVAWIWRRTLIALGYAHENGIIHGAVFPSHILIHPTQHGVVLADWCYSSIETNKKFPPLDVVVDRFRHWYPPEVEAKTSPSAATDISIAAKSMIDLLGGNPLTGEMPESVPREMQSYFRGCTVKSQRGRPQSTFQALGEFDHLLEELGGSFYPRKYRPLDVQGIAVGF
jgi:hypothetical protein